MESLKSFQETIDKVDFDSLTAQLQKMQSFDLYLQHLLLNEDSLKVQQSQSKTMDDSIQSISCEMIKLQDQVTELVFLKFNTYFTSVVPTALLLQCNWPITGIRRVL